MNELRLKRRQAFASFFATDNEHACTHLIQLLLYEGRKHAFSRYISEVVCANENKKFITDYGYLVDQPNGLFYLPNSSTDTNFLP